MRRMQNVDKHPKTGVFRVRVTFPAHLHKILGAGSATQSLKTKNATDARRAAIPVLSAFQRRISEAEKIYQAEKTGEVVQLELTLDAGVRLIEQWRDAYLARPAAVLTTGQGTAGGYLALGDSAEDDWKILGGNSDLLVKLYYSNKPIDQAILSRTLDRILTPAGYVLPERHRMRVVLIGVLRNAINTIRTREDAWKNNDWSSDTLPPVAPPTATAVMQAATHPEQQAPQVPTAPAHRAIRLRRLLEVHAQRKQSKSRAEQALAVEQLCGFVGQADPFAHEITFEQAEQFYETLLWLPKAMTVAMRGRPLAEVAADMRSGKLGRPRAASGTASKKIQLLSALFTYAIDRNLMAGKNPFARVVGPKDSKRQTKRRPMSSADLKAIFSAPLFAGCASYKDWRSPRRCAACQPSLLGALAGAGHRQPP